MTISRRKLLLATLAAPAAAVPQLSAAKSIPPIAHFLALSARLTGFPVSALNAGVGGALLASLKASGSLKPSDSLMANATLSPALRAEIISAWYSGVRQMPAGDVVLTHSDALVWRSAEFLHLPGQCGGAFGHWSVPPTNNNATT